MATRQLLEVADAARALRITPSTVRRTRIDAYSPRPLSLPAGSVCSGPSTWRRLHALGWRAPGKPDDSDHRGEPAGGARPQDEPRPLGGRLLPL